jgi:7-carboxy-7-deazaguanine synthase
MTYTVKEIFYTLQGEGLQTGRPAVFCRFSGCNLWSGKESDRPDAICKFCDTDFADTTGINGGAYNGANDLARAIAGVFPGAVSSAAHPFVVLTGGEPALQADGDLIDALHEKGFEIAIETNGTLALPESIDWVTVSPKAQTELVVQSGDELKLLHPQVDAQPERFESLDFRYFWLQPLDGPNRKENTLSALQYCLAHPQWRLSLQIHKVLGIP